MGMKKLFVIGGMGAGKSTARKVLAEQGVPFIDLDKVGHDVLLWDTVKADLVEAFGADILGADGQIVRSKVAAKAFATPAETRKLNRITMPRIEEAFTDQLDELERQGNKAVVVEYSVFKNRQVSMANGADVVIAIGHCGIDEQSSPWMSKEVIANTTGFDAFIDGHSHSTFSETIKDKSGKEVVFEQTGTKLANVGKIIIKADGTIPHENVDLNTVEPDAEAAAYIQTITDKFDALQKQVVAKTSVELTINGADGKRAVRNAETNLGDLCADAYRILLGADIAFVNGGGVRDNIKVGDITYGDIIKVHPFGNEACLVEVTGQQIKDALELGSAAYPGESGGFLQVSGLTYTVDTAKAYDALEAYGDHWFTAGSVSRVSISDVNGQPFDETATYAVVTSNANFNGMDSSYVFKTAAEENELSAVTVAVVRDVVWSYIASELNNQIGDAYAAPQGRLTVQ